MIVKILVSPKCVHLRRLESLVSLVNGCQRHYRLELHRDGALDRTGTEVNPQALAESLEAKHPDKHVIGITEDPFDDNWFSHEYRSSAVITVADWEAVYAPPSLRAYVVYQVAQALSTSPQT